MVLGELAANKVLKLACTTLLPGWLLLWLYVAFVATTSDSTSFSPCTAASAVNYVKHRRAGLLEYPDAWATLSFEDRAAAAGVSPGFGKNSALGKSRWRTQQAPTGARHVENLQHATGSFSYLCMQVDCDVQLMCLSAAALRLVGGWTGTIYVITDHPEALHAKCEVPVTEVYAPARDHAGMRALRATPLTILPAGTDRTIMLDAGTITVSCLAPFFEYLARLEPNIGMSITPDDMLVHGRHFHAGLVVHRNTKESQECSAAWEADILARVARQGPAASDAESLEHIERDHTVKCRRHHRLPRRWAISMDTSTLLLKAKLIWRRPVFSHYGQKTRSSWYWPHLQHSLHQQLAALAAR